MTKPFLRASKSLCLVALFGPALCIAQNSPASAPSPDLNAAIHDYLLAHPEVVLESVRAYDAHRKQAEQQRLRDNVRANLPELTQTGPSVGSKASAPVTVVEFFDYRCGYCKKAADTVLALQSLPGVRVVYKDLPILGGDSVLAAQAALAAQKRGAYEKLHNAMLASAAPLTAELIDKLAKENGLDTARLKADMQSPEINTAIARNEDLAQRLHIEATPTFVIGDQMVSGALSKEAFQSLIDKASGKSVVAQAETAASPR